MFYSRPGMKREGVDSINLWFYAAEELGEYIGIRFGHLPPGATEPEWIFLRHTDFDGIGGLAHIFRQKGVTLGRLPQIRHPAAPSVLPLFGLAAKFLLPRHHVKWLPLGETKESSSQPPPAVAWHVFDELATLQMRRVCRMGGVTVNSFLLKHLTEAIRPSLDDQSAVVPWMVPVNLRGKVVRDRDSANYSSYVSVKVKSYETPHDVHRNIYAALGRREHWANWYACHASRLINQGMRKFLITQERALSQWNLGSFSNLGSWDAEKEITQPACQGNWLFCPPVFRCQLLGTGCITFQNRLSLVIQAHPELTIETAIAKLWMQNWVKEIEMDLASGLADPTTFFWRKTPV